MLNFKPNEGMSKERCYRRKLKREFYEAQMHKLPNEFRHAFTNFNRHAYGGVCQIDENDYGPK